jgi:hypothetical protein
MYIFLFGNHFISQFYLLRGLSGRKHKSEKNFCNLILGGFGTKKAPENTFAGFVMFFALLPPRHKNTKAHKNLVKFSASVF